MYTNFVFEDLENSRNFVENWGINKAGSDRFTVAPLYNRMVCLRGMNEAHKFTFQEFTIKNKPDKYIIPVGVNNDPEMWAGGKYSPDNTVQSFFEFLSKIYLKDLREGNAYLLIDSSFEGYHCDWIFDFFHNECNDYEISPNQIFFVTGNSIVEDRYKMWLEKNPQKIKIHTLPYSHFESDVFSEILHLGWENNPLKTFEEHLDYKINNIDNIKLYNNLNKKAREHRVWFFVKLYEHNLLEKGLISMNKFPPHQRNFCDIEIDQNLFTEVQNILPYDLYGKSNEILDTGYYIRRIYEKPHLDSWLSVISEAQYEDSQGTVFLSEKMFKPISCYHPFIVLGNKNSLYEMKKLGYQTFSKWIDEGYDTLSDSERMKAIIESIKQFDKEKDKLSIYKDMKDVLIHNYKVLEYNASKKPPHAFDVVQKIFTEDVIEYERQNKKFI
jgi:hypothetical protein